MKWIMKRYRVLTLLLVALMGFRLSMAQSLTLSTEDKLASIELFKELLSIPNDAHFHEDIEKNIVWCESAFDKRNFTTKRIPSAGIPLLLAEYNVESTDRPTLLVYLQVDGQPVDPTFWFQTNPYTAVLKERSKEGDWQEISWARLDKEINPDWRIFARSASDAKGPVAMFLYAIDLIHRQSAQVPFNLKVIMDFEEELGSPNLADAVAKHKHLLKADHLVIFDGPPHLSNQPTLTFGARGITTVTLTTYGPNFPQHSGHYGNYVPNPAIKLSQLIATFKDWDGRVLVDGWYDGIRINDKVKKVLAAVPDDENEMRYKIGFAEPDQVAPNYQESLQYPSLNVRGLRSGWVGDEVRTIIPATAIAEIDIRTVKESDPEDLIRKLRRHIEQQGFYITAGKPEAREKLLNKQVISMSHKVSYQAFRTAVDGPTGQWLRRAMKKATGKEAILKRTSGGSIPISPFVNTLDVPAVTVPTVNPDNNQHSPNENLRLGNYFDGIGIIFSVLTTPI